MPMKDEELAKLSLPELIGLLNRLVEEIALRAMELTER